eukprot:2545615-Rhodomonas_salina.1
MREGARRYFANWLGGEKVERARCATVLWVVAPQPSAGSTRRESARDTDTHALNISLILPLVSARRGSHGQGASGRTCRAEKNFVGLCSVWGRVVPSTKMVPPG